MNPTPPTQPGAIGAPSIHMGVVEGDRGCIRCSYNLKGLSSQANCPECGTPVADSMRGVLLQYAAGEYLADLKKGLSLILNAIMVNIVFLVLAIVIGFAIASTNPGLVATFELVIQILSIGIAAMSLWGYWLVSQPDPQFGIQESATARGVLRAAAVAGGAIALGTPIVDKFLSPLSIVFAILSLAAFAVQFFAMMMHAKWLGRRVPDSFIVKRASTYMWLLPLLGTVGALVLVGPTIALVLYWNLLDRIRKHVRSIQDTGSPAALPKMAG